MGFLITIINFYKFITLAIIIKIKLFNYFKISFNKLITVKIIYCKTVILILIIFTF